MIRTFKGTINSWYLNLRALELLAIVKSQTEVRFDHYTLNLNIIQNLAAVVEGSTRSLNASKFIKK